MRITIVTVNGFLMRNSINFTSNNIRCGEQSRIDNVQFSCNAMTRGGSKFSFQGRQSVEGQHTSWPLFSDNCMKMSKIGPEGGAEARLKFYYVDEK